MTSNPTNFEVIAETFDRFLHQEGARQRAGDFADELIRSLRGAGYVIVEADDGRHVIEFREDGWTVKHPLGCRPDLFACRVNRVAGEQLSGPPPEGLGRYVCSVDAVEGLVLGPRVAGGARDGE